jgi:hypothetical protein
MTKGKVSVTLEPLTVARPAAPYWYLGAAESLLPSVKVLASAKCGHAMALVSANILECLLSAYLTRSGKDNVRKDHKLTELWRSGFKQGLQIDKKPPDWVNHLSDLYKCPFQLRYGKKIHAITLPPAYPMTSDLMALLEIVRKQLP